MLPLIENFDGASGVAKEQATNTGTTFRFRRNAKIGEAAAEMDDEFLLRAFYDIGDYAAIRDTRDPARIVVGRTGSGKSALLRYLKKNEEHVIEVEPEHLSLNFIANNDVIRFFENLGVKLDLFYQLLWRHVFTVELLKERYQLTTSEKTQTFVAGLLDRLKSKDKARERAIRYLQEWGDKFWIETEYRVKEFTTKLAAALKAEAGVDFDAVKLSTGAELNLSEEQKKEIVHRGQQVVNSVQVKELSEVISYLNDEVFSDVQRPYYITIDRLDENWVDDSVRLRLIRALLETVKSFQRVQNVKIVVALRLDLLQNVFGTAAASGFQEEKYQALLLRLRWRSSQLEEMLDRRVSALVRQQFTQRPVKLRELFPAKIGRSTFIDYLMERTALRPRDAILFVNDCISRSEELGQVRVQTVFDAEREYSKLRLKSLIHEWSGIFPSIPHLLPLLDHSSAEGKVSSLGKDQVDEAISKIATMPGDDPAISAARAYLEAMNGSRNGAIAEIVLLLYGIGAIGLRLEGGSGQMWAPETAAPSASQIKQSTKVLIHPMFHQALNIKFQ